MQVMLVSVGGTILGTCVYIAVMKVFLPPAAHFLACVTTAEPTCASTLQTRPSFVPADGQPLLPCLTCNGNAMQYLDPVVVSVAMLSEPFAGVANGVLMGQATWPGILGWVGGVVSVCGALVVMAGSRTRSTTATVH